MCADGGTGWAGDDCGSLVVRLVVLHRDRAVHADDLGEGRLERRTVSVGTPALDEGALALDLRGDDVLPDVAEDTLTLGAVGVEQSLAAPALQDRRQLPAEVHRVLEPVVEAESAVRRVRVRGVAGDEGAPGTVFARNLHAQVPEAEVLQVVGELGTDRLVEQLIDV